MDARWWRLLGFLCLGRALDIGSTFLVTPDLAREANPLVAATRGGWLLVCAITATLVAASMALYAYALRHPELRAPAGLGRLRTLAHESYGEGASAWHLLWRWPVRGRRLFVFGWLVAPALAIGTFPIFLHNLANLGSRDYGRALFALFGANTFALVAAVAALGTALGLAVLTTWRTRGDRPAAGPA